MYVTLNLSFMQDFTSHETSVSRFCVAMAEWHFMPYSKQILHMWTFLNSLLETNLKESVRIKLFIHKNSTELDVCVGLLTCHRSNIPASDSEFRHRSSFWSHVSQWWTAYRNLTILFSFQRRPTALFMYSFSARMIGRRTLYYYRILYCPFFQSSLKNFFEAVFTSCCNISPEGCFVPVQFLQTDCLQNFAQKVASLTLCAL